MVKLNNICTFYTSKWHLIIKVLPFLVESIENDKQIIVFTQKEIYENLKIVSTKVNIPKIENILDIDWSVTEFKGNSELYNRICNKLNNKIKKVILINGNPKYINDINKEIRKIINMSKIDNNYEIEIVDCYNILNDMDIMFNIMKNYDKKLETVGVSNIV